MSCPAHLRRPRVLAGMLLATALIAGVCLVVAGMAWGAPWPSAIGITAGGPIAPLPLTIRAAGVPPAARSLYPGGDGDVTVVIANPNPFPVRVSGVVLPVATRFAGGYADPRLRVPKTGCSPSSSGVTWTGAGGATETLRTFPAGAVVGDEGSLALVLVGAAHMSPSAPVACEGAYFLMPPLAGVVADPIAHQRTPGPVGTGSKP